MSQVEFLIDSQDKLEIALDRTLGVKSRWEQKKYADGYRWECGEAYDRSLPAFSGIREAYIQLTGDSEVQFETGKWLVAEGINSGEFPYVLANTLNRLLVQSYAEVDFGIDLLVPQSCRRSIKDFRPAHRVRVGYLHDLPQDDPEAIDWAELQSPTDEDISYSVVQFGGTLSITRKTVMNDDTGFVTELIQRAARAAHRTLARRVMNLLTTNPVIYDNAAWFNAAHGNNLRTNALSPTEIDAIRVVMNAQQEKDSGELLFLNPWLLVVPTALMSTAKTTNERQFTDADSTPNPVRHMFGEKSERIITTPLLTDADNYFTFADPEKAPCIELGFLEGRQEPEIQLADNPVVDAAFWGDLIRYKVRHEYEAAVIDYRGVVANIVD